MRTLLALLGSTRRAEPHEPKDNCYTSLALGTTPLFIKTEAAFEPNMEEAMWPVKSLSRQLSTHVASPPALISQQILLWANVSLEKRDGTG